jgi:hypothetical protein
VPGREPGDAVPPAWKRLDGLAFCVQKDAATLDWLSEHSYIHWVGPSPDGEEGTAALYRPTGKWFRWPAARMAEAADHSIRATWRRQGEGYEMEFFVPASSLAPLLLEPGEIVPLYYRLAESSGTIEEFCRPALEGIQSNWLEPRSWPAVRLGPKGS